jgi:hypothetical protein
VPRFFVWVLVSPVLLDGAQKEILAVRTITAEAPQKAIDDAVVAIRRELIQDLGVQALSEASYQVDHVARSCMA